MTRFERLFERLGYVPADRYVPQECVDEVEVALGEAESARDAAWVEADRERIKRAAAEDELEQRTRVVGVLLEEIGARS